MPGYSQLEVCNLALAELPDRPMASLDEQSLQARECGRVYSRSVEDLLSIHPWSFGKSRVSMPLLGANDRPSEWTYAYALPNGAGLIRKVINAQGDPSSIGFLTVGQWAAPTGASLWDPAPPQRFELAGTTLYTNTPSAVLEFVELDGVESQFTPLFARALYFDVASRIVMPLTKDKDQKKLLVSQAETWLARAKAENLNQLGLTYDQIPDAVAVLWGGIGSALGVGGTPPSAPGGAYTGL